MPDDTSLLPPPYAEAGALLSQLLRSALPPQRISVSDHAAKHRWLDNRGGGYVGRWSHDEAPYLVAPMEALSSPKYLTVAVPGPGRSGKTAVGENWLLQSVDSDPADMLWYEPTDDVVEAYVKATINPMIEQHEILRGRLGPLPVDRSIHFKNFRTGMWVQFLPMADNNLRNKSAPRIVVDEQDAANEALGDVYELADLRRQSFGRDSKVLAISHPDQAVGLDPVRWNRGVMRLYGQSTRGTWWWPCPHCNDFSSPNPTASRVMELHYREDAPIDELRESTRLLCPSCDALIEDRHRRAMNLAGKWVGLGQTIAPDGTIEGDLVRRDIAGFWIVGAMSPFIIGGIGALAVSKVQAERDAQITGDDKPLRLVMARRFGVPYEPRKRVGQVDANTLAARSEPYRLGTVPQGVRFLTAFIDVQNNRFEVLVRGWGVNGESWIVDMRRVPADPAVSPSAWDDLLGGMLDAEFPLADASGRAMTVRAIGVDSGGSPGVTQQAYAAWRRLRMRAARRVRFLGKIDGRDVFNLTLTKGASGPNATRLQVVYPNSKRRDRDARATGAEPVVLFNTNSFKDDFAGQLACGEAGAWYVHFPQVLRGDWPSAAPETEETTHTWFEQLVAERPDARGRWEKIRATAANEGLDLHVGCHVLADLHGLTRIKWESPPPWAASWDTSTSVVTSRAALHITALQPAPERTVPLQAPPPPRNRWAARVQSSAYVSGR